MDGETPKGCEPAPQSGGSEGQTGGSVPPGNNQVHSGETPVILGSIYYVKIGGCFERFTLSAAHEFQDAVTVYNGRGDVTVKRSELIPEEVHFANLFATAKAKYAAKYAETIRLWNAGNTTAKALATALGILPMHAGARIVTLKSYELITDPEPSHDANSDNPPVLQTDGGSSPN